MSAGETIREGARELEEELGIRASFSDLFKLGEYRDQLEGQVRGASFIDRELSHVFGYVCGTLWPRLNFRQKKWPGYSRLTWTQ